MAQQANAPLPRAIDDPAMRLAGRELLSLALIDARNHTLHLPPLDALRGFLLETLEATLELLDKAPETDEALYFFRAALFHEDLRAEQLVAVAQAAGVPLKVDPPAAAAAREPLQLPATRW